MLFRRFFIIFVGMKRILHISLLFLLSLVTDAAVNAYRDEPQFPSYPSSEIQSRDFPRHINDCTSLCLTSSFGSSFSREDSVSSPGVRSIGSGRRVQPMSRLSLRIIKEGHIVEKNHFHAFVLLMHLHPSGKFCFSRFLFSIHYLLI